MSDASPNDVPVILYRAKWIAPMDRPIIHDGMLAVSAGIIRAVGPTADLRSDFPHAQLHDHGDVILLPGLVNAHAHLELSALTPGEPPASFVDWLQRLIPRTPPDPAATQAFVNRGIDIGVEQSLRFGVTTVGDITRHAHLTRPRLKIGPLRVVSFGEIAAMAQRRNVLQERLAAAADRTHETDHLRIGISPHAPYSVEIDGYRAALKLAPGNNMPLATHLAETRDEQTFLANHAGPFRELWAYLDAWDDHVPTFAGGPIRFAHAIGLLDRPTLLAHVNYCDDDELALLSRGEASVVYCPRTHEYFGHPPHRFRDMLAAGVNVALGTDSCASSPDLNLLDDLRLARKIAREMPAEELWKLVTVRAARALRRADEVGSLRSGKAADFVAFDVTTDDPLQELLQSEGLPTHTWIGGENVAREARCKAPTPGA